MRYPIDAITENNHSLVCDYLEKQFKARSWWPRAQPRLAKQEYDLMHDHPDSLTVWCERWLDSSQLRKLEKSIQKPT